MAKTGPAKYSASASLQGYLYQCRYALLLMLRRIRSAPTARLAVEKFDDVSFEKGGSPRELVQTKFHATPGNLTDGSEDWWKTLRIWCEGVRDLHFLLPGVTFSLVTTQSAPAGSAAAALRATKSRDPARAETLLLAAAGAGANKQLADAFAVFKKLPKLKRSALLAEVWI